MTGRERSEATYLLLIGMAALVAWLAYQEHEGDGRGAQWSYSRQLSQADRHGVASLTINGRSAAGTGPDGVIHDVHLLDPRTDGGYLIRRLQNHGVDLRVDRSIDSLGILRALAPTCWCSCSSAG